jgi:serine protease
MKLKGEVIASFGILIFSCFLFLPPSDSRVGSPGIATGGALFFNMANGFGFAPPVIPGREGELFGVKEILRRRERRYVPDEVIVKFVPEVSARDVTGVVRLLGGRLERVSEYADFERVKLPRGMKVEEAVSLLKDRAEVVYAEPNYSVYAHFVPNDPYFSYQWHFSQIDLPEGWEISFGADPSVIVAVIDSGVAYEDYDKFARAPDFSGTNFVAGYDFVDQDDHPNDEGAGFFGHGTFVASVIAETTNNGMGVSGIAFNSSIMPLRVLDYTGMGTFADLAEAIRFAVINGARVINMSLGGPDYSEAGEEAVNFAYENGVILIASGGNEAEATPPPEDVDYPARYSKVLAVGATDYNRDVTPYSNRGDGLDVVAPGGDVSADLNNDGYGDGVLAQSFLAPDYGVFNYYFAEGTSASAPHASGVAALLISRHWIDDPDIIYDAFRYTAIDLGEPGKDRVYGYGLINAKNLLLGLGINK